MIEPSERDWEVAQDIDVRSQRALDSAAKTIAAYREELVRAEREKVLKEVERWVELDGSLFDARGVVARLRGESP